MSPLSAYPGKSGGPGQQGQLTFPKNDTEYLQYFWPLGVLDTGYGVQPGQRLCVYRGRADVCLDIHA
jgi:hypothetical protein